MFLDSNVFKSLLVLLSISIQAVEVTNVPGNGLSIEIDTILYDKPKENLCVDMPHIVNIGKEDQLYILSFEKEQCALERIFKFIEDTDKLKCPPMWDSILCWHEIEVNSTIYIPCPYYVNYFNTKNKAVKSCEQDPITRQAVWSKSNYQECLTYAEDDYCEAGCNIENHLKYFITMRIIGYIISLPVLTLSIIILLRPRLRCPRNYVHINLFIAFELRTILVMIVDSMIYGGSSSDTNTSIIASYYFRCRATVAIFRYLGSVYQASIFTQALYLVIIIKYPYYREAKGSALCILTSWLLPLLWMIPWAFARWFVDNYWCWQIESDMNLIIRIPHSVLLLLNIACAVFIIRNLYSKVESKNMNIGKMKKYRRLARTIVILIPMFGIHFTFFSWMPYVTRIGIQVGRCSEIVVTYIQTFLNAFAGLAISFTSCFIHRENRIEFILFLVETFKRVKCLRSLGCMSFLDSDYVTRMRYVHYFNLDPRTAYWNSKYVHQSSRNSSLHEGFLRSLSTKSKQNESIKLSFSSETSNKQSMNGGTTNKRINEIIIEGKKDTGEKQQAQNNDEEDEIHDIDDEDDDQEHEKPKTAAINNDDPTKQLEFYSTSKLIIVRL